MSLIFAAFDARDVAVDTDQAMLHFFAKAATGDVYETTLLVGEFASESHAVHDDGVHALREATAALVAAADRRRDLSRGRQRLLDRGHVEAQRRRSRLCGTTSGASPAQTGSRR